MSPTVSPWVIALPPLVPAARCWTWLAAAAAMRAIWPRSAIAVLAVDRDAEGAGAAAGPGICTCQIDLEEDGRRLAVRARPLCRHRGHQLPAPAAARDMVASLAPTAC
jgi:hypothetical protein